MMRNNNYSNPCDANAKTKRKNAPATQNPIKVEQETVYIRRVFRRNSALACLFFFFFSSVWLFLGAIGGVKTIRHFN